MVAKDAPAEWLAGQWAHEVVSGPASFELLSLTTNDLVVHEWGVFTSFNQFKDAESHRKKEWGSLPNFFYKQYPQERLRWIPANWNKPVVYFYTKEAPLQLGVTVTFAEGLPVVWWPAVVNPVNEGASPYTVEANRARPYRSLTWKLWLGHSIPDPRQESRRYEDPKGVAWIKVKDFELPADCWLRDARLPGAFPVSVIGNKTEIPEHPMPRTLDRLETERFLFYDGLAPMPDYLRCEKIDSTSVTLHNRAKFDIRQLFLVDRRTPGKVGLASMDRKDKAFEAGTTLTMQWRKVPSESWPQAGLNPVKKSLVDAGLFEAESDALLKIWLSDLFEADGITLFYILPQDEYDRMLPLTITPALAGKPTRVGIALHPHVEREPELAARVEALLPDLDDPSFVKRAAASKALLEIGPFAARVLRGELSQSPSAERKRRIEEVLHQLDAAEIQNIPGPVQKKK